MADNRNFVNKFANQGGGDIFVEDAKLSESTSTTTVTTEGFMLKGTDGAYYEIDKASLSEVIRAELGAILADNSKNNGTSVGKVPTLNSTGNALGASSVADLATVLGVGKTKKPIASGNATSAATFNLGNYFGTYLVSYGSLGIGALLIIGYGSNGYKIVAYTGDANEKFTVSVDKTSVSIISKSGFAYPDFQVYKV